MAPLAAEPFWKLLHKSGIIAREEVESLREQLQQQSDGFDSQTRFDTAEKIVDELIARKVLTRWQADKLLQGKHKGFLLGPYRIQDILGEGGMGTVFLAEHQMMRRLCAIKVLPPKQCKNDPTLIERFYREAQAVAALDHPNIVRAYDVNKAVLNETEVHYLVMEYVGGKDLQRLVDADGVLDYRDAAKFIRQAAEGLGHAHERGFVHRDIKPANLIVDSTGTVKVLDLGLARFFDPASNAAISGAHGENVLGTADYLAPEQAINSHTVDARADIYSLGQTGYFLLTGHAPFPSGTVAERLMAHQVKSPEPIERTRPDAPPGLLAIIDRMTAKKPDFRYQTAREVADAMDEWLGDETEEQDFQGFAARFQKQLQPSHPKSHEPTRGSSSATEETDLELAPLEDEEPPRKAAGKSGIAGKSGKSIPKSPSASGGSLASQSGTRKSPRPEAKSSGSNSGTKGEHSGTNVEADPLEDLALSSPKINLSRASKLDSSGAHPAVTAPAHASGTVLLPKPRRKSGLEKLIGSPVFWICVAAALILVLILAIVIASSASGRSSAHSAAVARSESPKPSDRPSTGTPDVAPLEPTADATHSADPAPAPSASPDAEPAKPAKPAADEPATKKPKPPADKPDVRPKSPKNTRQTPNKPTPPKPVERKPPEKPKPVDPKALLAGVGEFSVVSESFDPNPRSKLHARVSRELQQAAERAGLTVGQTEKAVLGLSLTAAPKGDKIEVTIAGVLKCADPKDSKAPAITVWQHRQTLGVVAKALYARRGSPINIFAPKIEEFFSQFVDDCKEARKIYPAAHL